jgi:hypothetical protein
MRYAHKRQYTWSPEIAYNVGLMTSDGCLSSDGRHLSFVSNDIEQLENFSKSINKALKISTHNDSYHQTAHRVQFSDTGYYDFLKDIGLTSNKSKTIGHLKIPDEYYCHFLRGVFDGDGTTYAYYDNRWQSSYMYYVGFASASKTFLEYLLFKNTNLIGTEGKSIRRCARAYSLVYGKKDSDKLYYAIYKKANSLYLTRKKDKLSSFIKENKNATINRNARVLKSGRQSRLRF